MPVAVSTLPVTSFWASVWSSATRFSIAVRRALASLDSSSTRLLTTVVACERRAFGWNSKPLTDFCAEVSAFWASFWAASKRFLAPVFCASETYSLTVSIARSAAPTPACRPFWASLLKSN